MALAEAKKLPIYVSNTQVQALMGSDKWCQAFCMRHHLRRAAATAELKLPDIERIVEATLKIQHDYVALGLTLDDLFNLTRRTSSLLRRTSTSSSRTVCGEVSCFPETIRRE